MSGDMLKKRSPKFHEGPGRGPKGELASYFVCRVCGNILTLKASKHVKLKDESLVHPGCVGMPERRRKARR